MIKWSLLLVIPTLLLCSTASAQYGDVVNGPDGPQSTMPIGDGDGGSGPSEPEWNIEFLYGSISGMMLSYEPAANCIQWMARSTCTSPKATLNHASMPVFMEAWPTALRCTR